MATYLSGSPTFLPTVQPFQPNLQLFAGALQMKQTQYDTNRKKISDLYGSLLNSPMTRDSNIEARDEFFRTIDYEIKKLANVDLSLEQNVNQAAGLFNSLYDNKNIVKDMIWTKNFNREMERGEAFRLCLDPEKCGGQFWEGGIDAMNYMREEFRNASDEDAMRFGDVRYTPYVNVQDMAMKMFKENKDIFDVKIDTPDGMWMVTTKNGELLEGNLLTHFQQTIGKDPRVAEYFKTKAYLERKNFAYSNAAEYGSVEAAEQAYITDRTQRINEALSKAKDAAAYQKDVNQRKAADLKENLDNGTIPYSKETDEVYQQMFANAGQFEATENEIGNAIGTANNSISSRSLALQGEALDNAMSMLLLDDELGIAAHSLAFMSYERTLKENPIAMKYQEHLWRLEEAAYEDALKDKRKEEEEMGDANDPLANWLAGGGEQQDVNLDPEAAYKQLLTDVRESRTAARTPETDVLHGTFDAAIQKVRDGGNGAAQAGQDAVAMVDQAIRSFANSSKYSKDSNRLRYSQNLLKKWNSKSAEEKLGWAKEFDMEEFTKDFSYEALRKTYEVAGKMYTPNAYNKANRNYLSQVSSKLGYQVQVAEQAHEEVLEWNKTMDKVGNKIKEKLLSTGSEEYREYYKYVTNQAGQLRGENSFAWHAAKDKSYTGGQGKSVVERFKNDPTTQAEYSNIYTRSVEQYNQMSPERKQQVGTKEQYVYNQIAKVAKNRLGNTNPTVVFTDGAGRTQRVDADKFFTQDGLVRSAYSRYANKWKPGEQSGFWSEYKNAQKVYLGIGSYEEERGAGDVVGDVLEFAGNIVRTPVTAISAAITGDASLLNPMKSVRENNALAYQQAVEEATTKARKKASPFLTEYKREFASALDEYTKELKGAGSFTSKNLIGFIDYSKPKAPAVIGEKSFLLNAFKVEGEGDALFTWGGPSNTLPTKSDPNASAFVRQIIGMAMKSMDKEGRPTWTGEYNAIGGGREDYQAYTIRLDDPKFANAFGKSTESVTAMYPSLFGEGANRGTVTIYLKDAAADNILHKQTKRTSLEKRLDWAGETNVITGGYDDAHKVKIYTNKSGPGYYLEGSIATGYNADGSYNFTPYRAKYFESGYSPDGLVYDFTQRVALSKALLDQYK